MRKIAVALIVLVLAIVLDVLPFASVITRGETYQVAPKFGYLGPSVLARGFFSDTKNDNTINVYSLESELTPAFWVLVFIAMLFSVKGKRLATYAMIGLFFYMIAVSVSGCNSNIPDAKLVESVRVEMWEGCDPDRPWYVADMLDDYSIKFQPEENPREVVTDASFVYLISFVDWMESTVRKPGFRIRCDVVGHKDPEGGNKDRWECCGYHTWEESGKSGVVPLKVGMGGETPWPDLNRTQVQLALSVPQAPKAKIYLNCFFQDDSLGEVSDIVWDSWQNYSTQIDADNDDDLIETSGSLITLDYSTSPPPCVAPLAYEAPDSPVLAVDLSNASGGQVACLNPHAVFYTDPNACGPDMRLDVSTIDPCSIYMAEPVFIKATVQAEGVVPIGTKGSLLLGCARDGLVYSQTPVDIEVTDYDPETYVFTVTTQPILPIQWGPGNEWRWATGIDTDNRVIVPLFHRATLNISVPPPHLIGLANSWLETIYEPDSLYDVASDLNCDGLVNQKDFAKYATIHYSD